MIRAIRRTLPGTAALAATLAGTLLVALTALGLVVLTSDRLQLLDNDVRDWVLAHQVPLLAYLLRGITHLGNAMVVVPIFVLLAGALSRVRATAEPLISALTAAGLLMVTVVLLKAVVGRPGPSSEPPGIWSGAWPSGHTATSTVVYGLLALMLWQHGGIRPDGPDRYPGSVLFAVPALLALPVLIAIGLVYCNYHWFSDVVGGFLLGIPIAIAAQLLPRPLLRPPGAFPPPARPTASQNRS